MSGPANEHLRAQSAFQASDASMPDSIASTPGVSSATPSPGAEAVRYAPVEPKLHSPAASAVPSFAADEGTGFTSELLDASPAVDAALTGNLSSSQLADARPTRASGPVGQAHIAPAPETARQITPAIADIRTDAAVVADAFAAFVGESPTGAPAPSAAPAAEIAPAAQSATLPKTARDGVTRAGGRAREGWVTLTGRDGVTDVPETAFSPREPSKLTGVARREAVYAVAGEVLRTSKEQMVTAPTLTDFLSSQRTGVMYGFNHRIDWMWDFGGTTAQEIFAGQMTPDDSARFAEQATTIETLQQRIAVLEPQEGMVRVAITHTDEENGGITMPKYQILAIFPAGEHVADPLDTIRSEDIREAKLKAREQGEEAAIFFEPQAPCSMQACGDLEADFGEQAFYIPFKELDNGFGSVNGMPVVGAENKVFYVTERAPDGTPIASEEPGNYLLTGLLGGFDNEFFRVRISDFFQRQTEQARVNDGGTAYDHSDELAVLEEAQLENVVSTIGKSADASGSTGAAEEGTSVAAGPTSADGDPSGTADAGGEGDGSGRRAPHASEAGQFQADAGGDPPHDGPPGGIPPEALGNPEDRYNPRDFFRLMTDPDYFRGEMPFIMTDIAEGSGIVEGLPVPPRVQNRMQALLAEGSGLLFDVIYREFAREQGWLEERELPGGTAMIMMPVSMTSLNSDQLGMWNEYLARGIPREKAKLAMDSILLGRLRELPPFENPALSEADAWLRRAPYYIAHLILPDMTDLEARLLFINHNAADVHNLANAPVTTLFDDETTVLRTLSELKTLSFSERMRENPIGTFEQVMNAYGITSVEDIQNAEPNILYKLIHPATLLESGILHGIVDREQTIGSFANAILERATYLRRQRELEGLDPNLRAAISQHEKYKVSGIPNEAAFWAMLLEPTEYPLTRDEVGSLYTRWRNLFIQERKNTRASSILERAEVSPENPLPDQIAGIEVTAENGNVRYDTIEGLLTDMQAFFIPQTQVFEQGITASGEEPAIDAQTRADLVSFLNRNKEMDQEDMNRIAEEIRQWDNEGARGPYEDPVPRERPNWYRFRGSRFSQYGVSVFKDRQGYHLFLRDYENDDTNNIENFAAYVNKDVDYGGSVRVKLVAAPVGNPQIGIPLGSEEVTAETRFSVRALAQYFGTHAGLTEQEVQQLITAAVSQDAPRIISERAFARLRSIVFDVPHWENQLTSGEYDEASGEVTQSSELYDSPESDEARVPLPSLVVSVRGRAQERINQIARFFTAAKVRANTNLENQNVVNIENNFWTYNIRQEE